MRAARRQFLFRFLLLYLCLSVFLCGFSSGVYAQAKAPKQAAKKAPAFERVDLLIAGGTVVTMDAERRVLEDGAIAVRGDAIVAVGTRAELAARYAPARRINASGKLVLPGLINGHTHV